MSEAKIRELRSDIDELNGLLKQAQRKKVQDFLSLEIRKLETEWTNLKEQEKAAAAGGAATTPMPSAAGGAATTPMPSSSSQTEWTNLKEQEKAAAAGGAATTPMPSSSSQTEWTNLKEQEKAAAAGGAATTPMPSSSSQTEWTNLKEQEKAAAAGGAATTPMPSSSSQTEWTNLKEQEKAAAAGGAAATPMPSAAGGAAATPMPSSSSQNKRYQIKLNGYGWDQSDKYVKVFVTLKNVHTVPKEQVYCKLTDRSMELHVENLDHKDYLLVINKLLDNINVEESHWKQKTDMVVVFLAKSHPNMKWSHMTEIEKKFEDQRNNRFKTPEMDMDKKDPQESIMGLMKNMYETGDDEMKRMISKAWYEGQHKKKTDTIDF